MRCVCVHVRVRVCTNSCPDRKSYILILMIFKWHLNVHSIGKCQVSPTCSCMKFSLMQNIVWLWEVIYVVFPPVYLKSNLNGVNMAKSSKDNKNSYFAHTNNIMRFSTSERWATSLHEFFIGIQCFFGTIGCVDLILSCFIIKNYEHRSQKRLVLYDFKQVNGSGKRIF